MAIAGIVMMTYADGFHSRSVIAISFVVASASTSAIYKVRGIKPKVKAILGHILYQTSALQNNK